MRVQRPVPGPRFPAGLVLAGLLLAAAGPAAGDEARPGRAPAPPGPGGAAWRFPDGDLRVLVQPEFRPARRLQADLRALGIRGLRVDLVTPLAVGPWPADAKAPPPPGPSRLLLTGPAPAIATARRRLARLDAPPGLVEVSVLVSEVRARANTSRGASLLYDKDGVGDPQGTVLRTFATGFEPEAFLVSSLTGARPFEGSFLRLGKDDVGGGAWESTLRMLAKQGEAEFLAWPNLQVSEGHPARIEVIQNLPHVELDRAGTNPLVKLFNDPVGLRLGVTALRVGREQAVLDLDLWLNVPEAPEGAGTMPGSLILGNRQLRTRVTVRDGEPLLLGGLYLRRFTRKRKGLPAVSGIALVDLLLSADDRACVDTELVFLVRARIRRLAPAAPARFPPPPPPPLPGTRPRAAAGAGDGGPRALRGTADPGTPPTGPWPVGRRPFAPPGLDR